MLDYPQSGHPKNNTKDEHMLCCEREGKTPLDPYFTATQFVPLGVNAALG